MALYGTLSPGYQSGFRNYLINGNFDIWQRGTSTTTMTTYLPDRWTGETGTTGTQSQQSFTVGQTDVPNNPTYFWRWNKTGTGDYSMLVQKIEDVRTLAGKTCTVSFWAKADSSITLGVTLTQNFGSGGSTAVTNTAQTATLSTSWAKYTFTFSLASISGKTIGINNHLKLIFWPGNQVSSSTHTFDLAQVQLEEGPIATPFETRPISLEWLMCYRYFFDAGANQNLNSLSSCNNGWPTTFHTGAAGGTVTTMVDFPTPMRCIPSFSIDNTTGMNYNWNGPGSSNITSIGGYNSYSQSIYRVSHVGTQTSSFMGQGQVAFLTSVTTSNKYWFSAEL